MYVLYRRKYKTDRLFCRLKKKFVAEEVRKKYQLESYYCEEDRYRVNKNISTFVEKRVDLLEQLLERDVNFREELNLELACGTGEFLIEQSKGFPEQHFLGVDYTDSVVQRAIILANRMNVNNVAFFCGTGSDCLVQMKQKEIFSKIWINFPDPWPKKSHYKRRLLQTNLLKMLFEKLKKGGLFITATDHAELSEHHKRVIESEEKLQVVSSEGYTTLSRYHQKAMARGREIYYTFHKKIE